MHDYFHGLRLNLVQILLHFYSSLSQHAWLCFEELNSPTKPYFDLAFFGAIIILMNCRNLRIKRKQADFHLKEACCSLYKKVWVLNDNRLQTVKIDRVEQVHEEVTFKKQSNQELTEQSTQLQNEEAELILQFSSVDVGNKISSAFRSSEGFSSLSTSY